MDHNSVQPQLVNNHNSDGTGSIITNPSNEHQSQQSCLTSLSSSNLLQTNNLQSHHLEMTSAARQPSDQSMQMDNRTAAQAMSSNTCPDSRLGMSRDLNIPIVRPPSEPHHEQNDRHKSAALTMTSPSFSDSRMGLPRDFNIPRPFSEPRVPRPYSVPPDPKALQPFLQANYDQAKSWMTMDFRQSVPSGFSDGSRSFMSNTNGPRPILMPDARTIPPLVSLDLSIPKPSITTSSYAPSPLLGMGAHGLRPLMSSGFGSPRPPVTSTGGNKRGRPRKNSTLEFHNLRPSVPVSNGKECRGLMLSESSNSSSPVFPGSSSDPGPHMGNSSSSNFDCSAEARAMMNSLPNTPRLSNIMDVLSPRALLPIDFTSSRMDNKGGAELHGGPVEEKPFKCNVCGRGFVAEQSLEIHMRTHNESRPFHCEVCNQHFTQKSGLLAHMRIHTDERPFKCHVCLKAFRQQGGLTVHMRTHSGERPYKCFECGKEFTQQTGLNAHSRIHSGIRPYKCTVCNRLFTQQSGLVVHMRRHSGIKPFKCDQCGKAFAQQSGLIAHIRTHNTEKPFMCNYCQKRFKQQSSLATHLRTNHAEIPEPQMFDIQ